MHHQKETSCFLKGGMEVFFLPWLSGQICVSGWDWVSTVTISKLQSSLLPPGICGQNEDHVVAWKSAKSPRGPDEGICQVQVTPGHQGWWWVELMAKITNFQKLMHWCSPPDFSATVQGALNTKKWKWISRFERLPAMSVTGNHYLEGVCLTTSFLVFSQFELWKDPGWVEAGKSIFIVSNLVQFGLITGNFVKWKTLERRSWALTCTIHDLNWNFSVKGKKKS